MTRTDAVVVDRTVGGHRGWRIVAALAVTQTIGYGVLYYAFAVLLRPMAESLGASPAAVTGALTASILAGAAVSVPVGRWLDRHGGRALMTTGSIAATALVLAWSQVRTVAQLYAVMIGIGLTMAMVLYDPALAVVVSWFDERRRANAVLGVILVAGFASTIFFPLTAVLVEHHGWRGTLVIWRSCTASSPYRCTLWSSGSRRSPPVPHHPRRRTAAGWCGRRCTTAGSGVSRSRSSHTPGR